jgi:hypothetical protein
MRQTKERRIDGPRGRIAAASSSLSSAREKGSRGIEGHRNRRIAELRSTPQELDTPDDICAFTIKGSSLSVGVAQPLSPVRSFFEDLNP